MLINTTCAYRATETIETSIRMRIIPDVAFQRQRAIRVLSHYSSSLLFSACLKRDVRFSQFHLTVGFLLL